MKIAFELGQNLFADGWTDYELLDSGNGQKLERFGPYLFIRPEPQALWAPQLDEAVWQSASGRFAASDEERGKWELDRNLPETWVLEFDGLKFEAMPTPFRHLGFFPEQSPHWRWTETQRLPIWMQAKKQLHKPFATASYPACPKRLFGLSRMMPYALLSGRCDGNANMTGFC